MPEKLTHWELEIINEQKHVYKIGKFQEIDIYDYRRSELQPPYIKEVLDPFIKQSKNGSIMPSILDLGAGIGLESAYMRSKDIKITEADISKVGLKAQNDAIQAVAWRLPFPDEFFNGVHSKDMITHVPPEFRQDMFFELNRVTKPGGIVLICSINEQKRGFHQYPTSSKNLVEMSKKNGFVTEYIKEWKPSPNFNDWYHVIQPRIVLEFKKVCRGKRT